MIDGESAFSEKNMNTLGIDDLEAVRIWPSTGRKVSIAERAIRTVGLYFFKIILFFSLKKKLVESYLLRKCMFQIGQNT